MKFLRRCSIFLICTSLFFLGCGQQPQKSDPLAVLEKIVKGDGLLKKSGEKDFAKIPEKTTLGAGDVVKTSDQGEVVIAFATGAVTRVLPNSEFEISAPKTSQTGVKTMCAKLLNGVAAFYVPKGNEGAKKFEVETDLAVASIKGTTFKLEHRSDTTTLTVLEGKIAFRSLKNSDEKEVGEFEKVVAGNSGLSAVEKANALQDPDLTGVDKIIKGTN